MHTSLEILCNLTDETLEWKLADQQLGWLLIATNFTQRDSTLNFKCMRFFYMSASHFKLRTCLIFLFGTRINDPFKLKSIANQLLTGTVSMRLLHASSWWCRLACCLCCELLSWGLASSWFTCCLLCTCHSWEVYFHWRWDQVLNELLTVIVV
jgi:hypothetical protein